MCLSVLILVHFYELAHTWYQTVGFNIWSLYIVKFKQEVQPQCRDHLGSRDCSIAAFIRSLYHEWTFVIHCEAVSTLRWSHLSTLAHKIATDNLMYLLVTSVNSFYSLACRLATPKDTWPRMDKPGLTMELGERKDE